MGEAGHSLQGTESDEHDQSPLPRNHRAQRDRSGQRPDRINVQFVGRPPAAVGDLFSRRGELAASAVDQYVNCAEVLDRRLDHPLDLVGLAHVHRHRHALAAGTLDLRGGGQKRVRASPADHDAGPGRGELAGHGTPDARAAPGDQHDATLIGTRAQWRRSRDRFRSG